MEMPHQSSITSMRCHIKLNSYRTPCGLSRTIVSRSSFPQSRRSITLLALPQRLVNRRNYPSLGRGKDHWSVNVLQTPRARLTRQSMTPTPSGIREGETEPKEASSADIAVGRRWGETSQGSRPHLRRRTLGVRRSVPIEARNPEGVSRVVYVD